MSLNNIILSPVTLSSLYRQSLVELDEAPIASGRIKEAATEALPKAADSLINTPESIAPAPPAVQKVPPATVMPAAPLQFLGKNLKNIVLLVHYPDQVYLPEEQLNFLTAILNACKLNMGDIAILNNARQQTTAEALKEALNPRQMVLFGNFGSIVSGAEQFVIKEIGGMSVLGAPELETLNNTTESGKLLKGKLWGCLKQLFNV